MTVTGADFHQRQHTASRPRSDRATLHLIFVGEIKRLRHLFAVVAVKLLPSVPQIHAVRPFEHGFKLGRVPKRVVQRAVQHAVVVQDGADINHVKLLPRATQGEDGFFQPSFEFVALLGVAHLFVVLDIVEDGEVGAVWAVAQTAQLFATARHLDFDFVCRYCSPRLPNATLSASLRKVGFKARVELKFRLDCLQHGIGLVDTVHHYDRVMLAPRYHTPKRKQLRNQRRFRLAARGGGCLIDTFRRPQDFG